MVPLGPCGWEWAGLSLSLWAKLAVLAVMVLLPGGLASVGVHGRLVAVFCGPGALYFIGYGLTGRGPQPGLRPGFLCGMMYLKKRGPGPAGISLAMLALGLPAAEGAAQLRGRRPLLLLVLLALAPVIIWGLYVHYLALENDLFAGEVMERLHTAWPTGLPW